MEHILITGVCGFIGYHLARRLFEEGAFVVGIDNLNPYYEVALKKSRLSFLEKNKGFSFVKGDLGDRPLVRRRRGSGIRLLTRTAMGRETSCPFSRSWKGAGKRV
jgi:nucleoside-diphosphate-sugar epimerase